MLKRKQQENIFEKLEKTSEKIIKELDNNHNEIISNFNNYRNKYIKEKVYMKNQLNLFAEKRRLLAILCLI